MPISVPIHRAVVFDLDGTLLDSLADIGEAANAVLARLGLAPHALEEYRQFVGEGVAVLFQRALAADRRTDEIIAHCVSEFQIAYGRNWNIRTKPYAGIPALLDSLTKMGLKMAVLSNKPHEFAQRCVDHYFPASGFEVVFGQRQGVPQKPDPAGALEIAQRLGIAANESVYVGDSAVDMETARNARMLPIGVEWGFRSVDELRAAGAVAVIAEPQELLGFLERPGSATVPH
ncbi:MAG TPA: HAD family hydrolase [Pirellulales bacterium]|nr:HAD family hydrolase [Pirellulales bacterium]